MTCSTTLKFPAIDFQFPLWQIAAALIFACCLFLPVCAQINISQPDEKTLIVGDAKDSPIYSLGKTVIVKGSAKEVMALGGDIIIEGTVEGDVGTIGGSVYQKENAFVGGDVIAIGGIYQHDAGEPLRTAGKETIMFASYEEELRNAMQNPLHIFAPEFSWSFFAIRILAVLFWFVVSLGLTTIAPGAVSRSVARFQLSTLKVVALGLLGAFVSTIGVVTCLKFTPNYVGPIIGLMAFVLVLLAYVYGRVTIQVSLGKWLQKQFLPEKQHSESIALLLGAFFLTALLSIPYFWSATLFVLFIASLGLVLTARSSNSWQKGLKR